MAAQAERPAGGSAKARQQVAALPFRHAATLEVLLVSTLESRRWVIPKGWPIKGHESHEAAAREAFEEAGVTGEIAVASIGVFHYFKRKKSGAQVYCRVSVYPMRVEEQRRKWPEMKQRQTRWLPIEEAAAEVSDPELADLLRNCAASLMAVKAGKA